MTNDTNPPDPALEHFSDWWRLQTAKGDPARRPNLARDAYLSGHTQAFLATNGTGVSGMTTGPYWPTAGTGPGTWSCTDALRSRISWAMVPAETCPVTGLPSRTLTVGQYP